MVVFRPLACVPVLAWLLEGRGRVGWGGVGARRKRWTGWKEESADETMPTGHGGREKIPGQGFRRSEERRVGKECSW